jgi:hypothetical protein
LPDMPTSRRRGYLDRLLETGTTQQPSAARAPHQVHWPPETGPGADVGAQPQAYVFEADRPSTKSAAVLTEPGLTGPVPAMPRWHPSPLGVPPQQQASDTPSSGPTPAGRDAAETRPRVPTADAAARAQFKAASLRLEPPVLAAAGQGSPASEAIQIPAAPTQTTPVITDERGRTQPPDAPSVHIGSIEVRLTPPQAPAVSPSRPPAPAATRLSRLGTPFGLGQV